MSLNEILNNIKKQKKIKKRVGRGSGSGKGSTSGRGNKGHNCRSGGGVRKGFEGGQMPIYRRLPKRGFTNIFKKKYQIVNVESLNKCSDSSVVNKDILFKLGLIKDVKKKVKLLGKGNLNIALSIFVDKASNNAINKVKAVSGKIEGVI